MLRWIDYLNVNLGIIHLIKMQSKIFLILFFTCSLLIKINGQSSNTFPHTVLQNKHLKIGVYLPDTVHGYYRSGRFDWSGIISSVKYKKHEYFGEWFEKHDPLVHDAVTGPVEDFSAVGFNEAKTGEVFLKIGVGFLEKTSEGQYRFSTRYKIIDHGIWKIDKKKKSIVFTHSLKPRNGYGYEYKKGLKIRRGSTEMILTHSIKIPGIKAFPLLFTIIICLPSTKYLPERTLPLHSLFG
jgi:hypothetical protein